MRDVYAGWVLIIVGALSIVLGGVALITERAYFISRGGRLLTIPAQSYMWLYWFTVLFLIGGGIAIALFGRSLLQEAAMLPSGRKRSRSRP
jgi:hypothetical protein